MGFFDWVSRLLFGSGQPAGGGATRPSSGTNSGTSPTAQSQRLPAVPAGRQTAGPSPATQQRYESARRVRKAIRAFPFHRYTGSRQLKRGPLDAQTGPRPYLYARPVGLKGEFYIRHGGSDRARLSARQLPTLITPEDIARWLKLPVQRLAWLVHHQHNGRPPSYRKAHYHAQWIEKRTGGWRLIEAPKPLLKQAQLQILHEILNQVPTHSAAHGFVRGRSILSNATPHVGQAVVVKFDLQNFYPTVSRNRVIAIFRALGYGREAAIWLAELTTSRIASNTPLPGHRPSDLNPYARAHLPQGAPTSPALANLSAYSLDLRLAGLTRRFGGQYTRYADDLTFSGDETFSRRLRVFLPLVSRIIRGERFLVNWPKRRVLRQAQRQTVTGIVVNERPSIARVDFDLLKAILTNCIRTGPRAQNRLQLPNFAAHLHGRISYVAMIQPQRAQRLWALYEQIDWNRP